MGVYDYPHYYEIAISWQNFKKQVDFFEEVIKKYSKIPVKCVLDIACGTSPHLRELARRGYKAIGLDINPKMLMYLKSKAYEEGVDVEVIQADMNNFKLKTKCDLALLLSGSIFVNSNKQFLKHLDCVADALNSGGIYLLENFPLELYEYHRDSYTEKKNGIEVTSIFESRVINKLEQLYEEAHTLLVNDHGKKLTFSSTFIDKLMAPQEFRLLIDINGKFEFIGWFEHFELKPLKVPKANNIIILRRK